MTIVQLIIKFRRNTNQFLMAICFSIFIKIRKLIETQHIRRISLISSMVFTQENYRQALNFFKDKDPIIYNLLLKKGYIPPPPPRNIFANLIGCIIGQKIRYNVARQQRGKLYTEVGTDDFTVDDLINRAILQLQENDIMDFSMDDIIEKGLLYLKDIGIDENRYQTIKRVINYIKENNIEMTTISQLDELKTIKGIGDWTINCTKIMFYLNGDDQSFDDCLLYQDLIIRRGIAKLYNIINVTDMIKLSASWSPWRSIVTWYLWKEFS